MWTTSINKLSGYAIMVSIAITIIQIELSYSEPITLAQRIRNMVRSRSLESSTGLISTQTDLDPIAIKGYKFFNSRTGENVLIKGIDYYPRPNAGDLDVNSVDYFTEEHRHIWERDIPQFQALGVNAIRLYSVDPDQDHAAFMCALSKAGIYVLVELASGACPKCAILSSEAPHCYPRQLKTRGEAVIYEFSKYSNTLAFSAGNEVNHYTMNHPPQWNAPCLKKFVRDMRAYVSKCDHIRHVPVGLIMADSDRDENTLYYNCQSGDDDLDHAEWYGINTYVYCNGTADSFDEAVGFNKLIQSFETYNYSIPVMLTEYGCLSKSFPTIDGYQGQRNFNQAKWLGMKSVQDEFAGGFAFEYSIEKSNARTPFPFKEFGEQNYGVGYLSPDQCDDVSIMCEYNRTPTFDALKRAYNLAHADNITMDEFEPDKSRSGRTTCPAHFPKLNSFHWIADWQRSLSCPDRTQDTWTCPADGVPNSVTTESQINGWTLLFTLFGFIGIIYAIMKFFTNMQEIHTHSSLSPNIWNVEKNASCNVTEESNGLIVNSNQFGSGYLSVTSRSSSE